ncbi:MAG: hypothetical protein JWP89_6600 [Schlesneria sp.]|nr:hypothetical protein [Schlesneria sp.]
MYTFFHGWRRKLGCVALVTACVFAVAWVRSFFIWDVLTFPVGRDASFEVLSSSDRFLMSYVEHGGFLNEPFHTTAPWRNQGVRPWWDVTEFGSTTQEVSVPPATGTVKRLSVGSTQRAITITLTLLSAYLILWEPRK